MYQGAPADNDADDTPMSADKHPQMIRIQGPNNTDTPLKCYVSPSPQPSMTMTALTAGRFIKTGVRHISHRACACSPVLVLYDPNIGSVCFYSGISKTPCVLVIWHAICIIWPIIDEGLIPVGYRCLSSRKINPDKPEGKWFARMRGYFAFAL